MPTRLPERARAGAGAGVRLSVGLPRTCLVRVAAVTPRDRSAMLSFDDVARLPLPGMAVPVQFAFSPGGDVLTYLYDPNGGLDRSLFVVDLRSARGAAASVPEPVEVLLDAGGDGGLARTPSEVEEEFTLEEQLRRERTREVGRGVTSATWAEESDALLVPLRDGVRVVRGLSIDPSGAGVTTVIETGHNQPEVLSPRLSPDGTMVAFVRDGDLYVAPADNRGTEPER